MMTSKHNSADHRVTNPRKIAILIYEHPEQGTVAKLPNGVLITLHVDCEDASECYRLARSLASRIVAAQCDYGSLGHATVSQSHFDKHRPVLKHKFIFTESARFPRKII
jgi:hypothetical protein